MSAMQALLYKIDAQRQKQHIALLRFKLRNYRILCIVLLVLHFIFYMSK